MLVKEAIGPAAAELGGAQVPDAAEHAGDSPTRPGERVFDLRERACLPFGQSGCVVWRRQLGLMGIVIDISSPPPGRGWAVIVAL